MSCDAFRDALGRYFHADDPALHRAEHRRHAAECPACARLLRLAEELSCREFVDFLDEYLDDSLAAERRATSERHLGLCPDCVRYLDAYRAAAELGRDALCEGPETDAATEPVPEELLRAILAARERPPAPSDE